MKQEIPPTKMIKETRQIEQLAYSMREAAQVLGVSYITVHRLVQRGLIKSSNALRTKVIPKWEIERFLRDTTV